MRHCCTRRPWPAPPLFCQQHPAASPTSPSSPPLLYRLLQRLSYVNSKRKWKKDTKFDFIEVIDHSNNMRILSSLVDLMMASPDPARAIPISAVSKKGRVFEISTKVATFLRRYPSFFEEFVGPEHNLPWFRPTLQAVELYRMEQTVFEVRRAELVDRVRRLILMSREKRLPLQILQGMRWYLGLPEDFTKRAEDYSDGQLRSVDMEDGVKGIAPLDCNSRVLSALQRNAIMKIGNPEKAELPPVVEFPLFLSKGVRLKQKVINWLEEFQKLPYVSPYEHPSGLHPNSRIAEKRQIGVLHELLSLLVDNSAERRKILCLRKHLGLSHKFYKAFEHHPHLFYLLLKNKTCTVVLKEAYYGATDSVVQKHPLLDVRKKYVDLMKESQNILRGRRQKGLTAAN